MLYYSLSFSFSYTTCLLLILLCCLIGLFVWTEITSAEQHLAVDDQLKELHGPTPFPIIGSLHLLKGYQVPYQAFRELATTYGEVFQIKLGSVQCVVVNGLVNIREVLMTKGDHFDGRPNFERYNLIFNGDKRNSLAFCDWSELQKTRRELLQAHTFPQSYSAKFDQLNTFIKSETNLMLDQLALQKGKPVAFKPFLLHTCANIFLLHFCGKRYDHQNSSFAKMTMYFDYIFSEVNQGYAGDFMSWLLPLYRRRFNKIRKWTNHIRDFTMEIVNERFKTWNPQMGSNNDYIDTLIETIRRQGVNEIDMDIAMFSLADIIGGHSAIANFLMKVMAYITTRPEVQKIIKQEILWVTKGERNVALTDRRSMPYTEAVIFESIRMIASPIVPHVASQDSSISGYPVKKGTMIFLNNYDLDHSPKLWNEPEKFWPERFLEDGVLVKPDHFFPFSTGRRSCMGYKMVQLCSFHVLSLTLQNYSIVPVDGQSYDVPIGDLALPFDTFQFKFVN